MICLSSQEDLFLFKDLITKEEEFLLRHFFMELSSRVKNIIEQYDSECPGVKANLVRLLTQGKLKNTGHLIIYPIDQGFEHGPGRSFSMNPLAYDPSYHISVAIKAGLSAFAAPIGFLECVAAQYAGQIPLILKINGGTTLAPGGEEANQAITGSIDHALRLGCIGIGYTLYPGSNHIYEMIEKLQVLIEEAKRVGLLVVVWAYPRGHISKEGERGLDVIAYGAHIAALLGAHVIKVKLPTATLGHEPTKAAYEKYVSLASLKDRVSHVVQSCFAGKRLVVFSGGEAHSVADVLSDTKAIYEGGGTGSIIGRNCFQRSEAEALNMLDKMIQIYQGKE